MVDENIPNNDDSVFNKVVSINTSSGELKTQFIVDVTRYDSSTMEGYKAGSKVYKGLTCKFATLKPSKQYPRSRIDIDPTDKDIRKAIFDMYAQIDQLESN